MKIYVEKSFKDFKFWGGAKDTVKYLTNEELDTVETILADCFNDGLSETEINDIFWFADDTIAKWLGYDAFADIMQERGF